jgi:hypothetical protein
MLRPTTARVLKYAIPIATILTLAGAICDRENYYPAALLLLLPGWVFTRFVYLPANWRFADGVSYAATWVSYFVFVWATVATFFQPSGPEESE